MSVKNLAGRLGVHDKTNHTLVSQSLSLGKIIGRPVRVTLFCENAPTIWDQNRLKGALKPGAFTPKAYTPKSPSGPLPPDSGPTQKTF